MQIHDGSNQNIFSPLLTEAGGGGCCNGAGAAALWCTFAIMTGGEWSYPLQRGNDVYATLILVQGSCHAEPDS